MLQWTAAAPGLRFVAVSCTTPMPSANGPTTASSHIGALDKALDEAKLRGWTVVDMKDDWKRSICSRNSRVGTVPAARRLTSGHRMRYT